MGNTHALVWLASSVLALGCLTDNGDAGTPADGGVGDARAPADGAVGGDDVARPPLDDGLDPDLEPPTPGDAAPDGPPPGDDCARACVVLDACGRCITDVDGACLSVDECAAECREDPAGAARSACLEALDSCDDAAVNACLAAEPMGDACDSGCASLDECGWCLPGEDDECLDVAGCAEACRATGGALGPCLEDAGCGEEEIDACLFGDVEDECFEGCTSLEACGWCLTDEDDECLDVAGCAEQCRADGGALGGCLVEAECEDDAVDACLADPDGCLQLCEALDVCEACIPEDDGCAEDCAEACAARDDVGAVLDCVAGAEMCDVEGCFEASQDDCAAGCASLDECGFCVVDDNDECLDIEGCAERCRDDGGVLGPCLLDAACEDDAIDACLEAPDGCAQLCGALEACEACLPDGDACADDCEAACAERGDVFAALECVEGAEMCDVAGCFEPPADDCEAGCASLDACGWCVTDENDECLDIASCAETCRDGGGVLGPCLLDAACEDDAIDGCLEAPDGCGQLCDALVACEACLPDGEACAEDCEAACAERDDVDAVLDCVEGAEMCDVVGCFEPPADDCEAGCVALDACDSCVLDDNEECLDIEGCAQWCRDGGGAVGPCLLDAECDDDAIGACLEGPPDPCIDICAALDACGACIRDGDGCAEDCEAACADRGEGALMLECVEGPEMCVIESCFEPPDDCEAGCVSLDECGWCVTDENDECLDVEGCAQSCRDGGGALGPCLLAAECEDEAIDVCLALPADPCEDLCAALDACEACIPDGDGCAEDCAAACAAHDDAAGLLACVEGAEMCDLAGCFDPAPDPCAAGCAAYDACELCFQDENNECLSVDDCAADCRASGEQVQLGCVAGVADCDGDALDACFEDPDPPVDDCEAGCRSIEGCGWCINEEDECLDIDACSARCRELGDALGPCLVAAGCDGPAVDICLEVLEPNVCAQVCEALDACEACIPDGDECAADCRAACEARDEAEDLLACVQDAEMCDLAACFPPPPDPCLDGCTQYDACEFCFVDGNDECLSVDECAADCRANGEEGLLACIADVGDCDEGAIDACLAIEPTCLYACEAILECDPPDGDLAEAQAACEADCADNPDGYDLECIVNAARCRRVRNCSP